MDGAVDVGVRFGRVRPMETGIKRWVNKLLPVLMH